jgi:hypothetical protein
MATISKEAATSVYLALCRVPTALPAAIQMEFRPALPVQKAILCQMASVCSVLFTHRIVLAVRWLVKI